MKKFILSIIFGIGVLFSFSSCVTSAYAYGSDDVDVNVVVRYGTPYYYGGSLVYYVYDGWYYYPYSVGGRHFYHRYHKPLPYHRPHYSPRPYRQHMSSTYRPHVRHSGGSMGHRPYSRPNFGGHRPSGGHRGGGLGGRR